MDENNVMESIIDQLMDISEIQGSALVDLAAAGNKRAQEVLFEVAPLVNELEANLLMLIHESTSDVPETIQ